MHLIVVTFGKKKKEGDSPCFTSTWGAGGRGARGWEVLYQLVQRPSCGSLTLCIMPVNVCVCVLLRDLTAGMLVIELLILSDLTARLAFLFHFMLLYIFFRLSYGRVQYVTVCR